MTLKKSTKIEDLEALCAPRAMQVVKCAQVECVIDVSMKKVRCLYCFGGSCADVGADVPVVVCAHVTKTCSYFRGGSPKVETGGLNDKIASRCFSMCRALCLVVFGANAQLSAIETSAFMTTSITSIVVPDSVTHIGDHCFADCRLLKCVTFGPASSLLSVGAYAFKDSGITAVSLPQTVAELGKHCFSCCRGLTSVTLPYNIALKTISDGCFSGVNSGSKIERITIPDGITEIGSGAFKKCALLREVVVFNSHLVRIGQFAFRAAGITSLTLPDTVQIIADSAFLHCTDLAHICFGRHCAVKLIGSHAFDTCRIHTLVLPPSVETLGDECFSHCSSLVRLIFAPGSRLKVIPRRCFFHCAILSVSIPNSVETLSTECFSHCQSLTDLSFGADPLLQSIHKGAFTRTSLTHVQVPTAAAIFPGSFDPKTLVSGASL